MRSGSSSDLDVARGYSIWFVLVTAGFITCLIAANITGVKLVEIRGWIVPAGVVVFPIGYIFGDVLTEVYGYCQARRVIWLGFFCNLLTVIAIWIGQILPPAPFWDGQAAYERILGYTPRLLMASFLAYLFGEFTNAYVLARLKIITRGRWLWMRTIGSTLVGQAVDSGLFLTLAFAGAIPFQALLRAFLTQWLVKSLYEAIATPATYAIVAFLKRVEGLDVYDDQTRFNPLSLRG
uniref:Probable queuosine precursor transporter n=1 Tax=uncultured Acidobacteriota bacterium TaxID=171953 RepID=H5SFD8_9BACT|nr:hypothetical conserved protein [uncultured Acidobacteriota bacterium]